MSVSDYLRLSEAIAKLAERVDAEVAARMNDRRALDLANDKIADLEKRLAHRAAR